MSIATPSKIIEISSEGERVGFNPTFKMELSDQTELVLSYEHANHERYIDPRVFRLGRMESRLNPWMV